MSFIYSTYLVCHPHGKQLLCDIGSGWVAPFLLIGFMLSILIGFAAFTARQVARR